MSIFLFSKDMLRCPICGGIYDRRDGDTICFTCGEKLIPEREYKGQPVYGSGSSKVTCPYCNSSNCKKISGVSKATSVAMFGIFSQKVKKQWHCNNCKSDF